MLIPNTISRPLHPISLNPRSMPMPITQHMLNLKYLTMNLSRCRSTVDLRA